jgi:hypothetical protein
MNQGFNLSHIDVFTIFQVLQPVIFYKGALGLLLIGYIIFHLVAWYQIRSMDRIITQPLSSSILGFVSLGFIASGIGLLIVLFAI